MYVGTLHPNAMSDYPEGYDTSAQNHPTVIPDDGESEHNFPDDPRGRYMKALAEAVQS